MPFKTAVQACWNAVRSWRPDREKRWHYVFMLFSWACFIFACWRTWQVVYGRMYYLLDSDMSSELVLSHLLRQEHKIVTQDWFYSTELRVFNIHWAFTPLFFLFDNWLKVRQIGTFIVLALMVLSCLYFCWQAGIRQLFPLIAAVMMTPVSDAYFRILLLTISYPPYITATFFTMGLLFRYMKTPCRRTRVIQLMIITAFAVLLGTNGLRQLLILYLPLFLGALLLAVLRSPARQGDTLPELDLATGRMLFGSTAALLGAGIGWQINAKVLRHIYHYTSQEGVQFKAFEGTRLERLLTGWLESFGYQDSGYITSTNLFYNAFCFLALLGTHLRVCFFGAPPAGLHPAGKADLRNGTDRFCNLPWAVPVHRHGLLHAVQYPHCGADDAGGGGLSVPPAALPFLAGRVHWHDGSPAAVVRQRLLHKALAAQHDRQP